MRPMSRQFVRTLALVLRRSIGEPFGSENCRESRRQCAATVCAAAVVRGQRRNESHDSLSTPPRKKIFLVAASERCDEMLTFVKGDEGPVKISVRSGLQAV